MLLGAVVLVVADVGLLIWLPWHRERQVAQRIDGWGGQVFGTETVGPECLQQLVGNDHLKKFKVFERVISVNLSRTAVTDSDLAHLSRLTSVRHLFVDGTSVTDVGLAHLTRLPKLQILSLINTAVTDACLADLSEMTNLRKLFLDGTDVTDTAIKELHIALPDCKIYRLRESRHVDFSARHGSN